MDGCRSWAAVLAVVLGVAAAIAYHLVLSVPWRYGLAHCRLTNHRVEGMKTGRAEVLQRTTSHETRITAALSPGVNEGSGILTPMECVSRGIFQSDAIRGGVMKGPSRREVLDQSGEENTPNPIPHRASSHISACEP